MGSFKFAAKNLPQGWLLGSVKDISTSFSNLRVPLKSADRQQRQGSYRYYGAQGVIDHIDDYIFDGKYLLVAEDGENVKSRKNNIAQVVKGKFWVNNHAHVLQGNHKGCTDFLQYVLNFISIKEYVTGQAQPKLNKAQLEKISIAVPPLDEQQKIAEVLSTVDQKIALIDQKIAETQKLKTGLMQKLFSEGVGVQDEDGNWQSHTEYQASTFGKIPKSWEVQTIEEISDVTSSKRIKKDEYLSNGVPFYRSKEIILKSKNKPVGAEIYISKERFEEIDAQFGSPQEGEILISAVGTIGVIYQIKSESFYFKDGNLLWLKNIEQERLTSDFLEYYLRSPISQERIKTLAAGSTQSALTIVKLNKLPVLVPPLSEQAKITEIMLSVSKKQAWLDLQKSNTQQLKKGLMQKLLTGEWRVPLDNH